MQKQTRILEIRNECIFLNKISKIPTIPKNSWHRRNYVQKIRKLNMFIKNKKKKTNTPDTSTSIQMTIYGLLTLLHINRHARKVSNSDEFNLQ